MSNHHPFRAWFGAGSVVALADALVNDGRATGVTFANSGSPQFGGESVVVRRSERTPKPVVCAASPVHECTYDAAVEAYSECGGKSGCRCQGVKVCSCGVSYTDAQWRALEQLGVQHVGCSRGIDDGGCCYELANCPCGSTLTRETMCTERTDTAA